MLIVSGEWNAVCRYDSVPRLDPGPLGRAPLTYRLNDLIRHEDPNPPGKVSFPLH
jgi:hypothetical protein